MGQEMCKKRDTDTHPPTLTICPKCTKNLWGLLGSCTTPHWSPQILLLDW